MTSSSQRFWDVREYGAKGDRSTPDREAIQAAIDSCSRAGGGTVLLTSGDYRTGTIHLKDNVTLHLDSGATLWGSTDPSDYDTESLIHAKDVQRISITGEGRIDGGGEAFWEHNGERWLPKSFRPTFLLNFVGCSDVHVRDVLITNAPGWTIRPLRSNRVFIRGVTILNDREGPNTDGIDPDCSTNVHISDCHINVGDDCIVIKTTEPFPCENITVTNCTLETSCAAIKLGTETLGDIRHCTFTNCTIRNTPAGITLYLKDSGTIEHIKFSNITMEPVPHWKYKDREWPIFVDVERRNKDSTIGAIRDVTFRDLSIQTKGRVIVQGSESSPVERFTIDGLALRVTGFEDLDELPKPRGGKTSWEDPEAGKHTLEAAHLVFSDVKGLELRNIDIVPDWPGDAEERSALYANSVDDLVVDGLHGQQSVPDGTMPALHMKDCKDVLVTRARLRHDGGTFLELEGRDTDRIVLMNNDLPESTNPVDRSAEVGEEAVTHRA